MVFYIKDQLWKIDLNVHNVAGESQFSQLSDASTCTCPSDTVSVTYECTVIGGFVTIWQGSAINKYCMDTDDQILLLHSCFESAINNLITCSNGTIVSMSVGIENNSYTSQLTIMTDISNILGDTVVCVHSHGGNTHVIGNATIELHTGNSKILVHGSTI